MAMLYVTNLDLNKNELQNARVQNLATAPSAPVNGQIYYDTDDDLIYYYNGSAWISLSTATGDITSVVAGTGLSGGATSGEATLNLADTAVTAAAYGSATSVATFTVDAQGRLTAAASTAITGLAKTTITNFDEEVQDLVGAQIVTNGSHSGIAATYDDAGDGAIDLNVDDFTVTLGGDLTGNVTITNLANGTLTGTLVAESVQDISGAQLATNGSHTGITATYDDAGDGAIDLALITENVQDITGAQIVTNGTHVGLTAAYDDAGDGAVDLTVAATLGTHTSGNYVATVAGTANEISVSGSGSETAAVTVGLPDDVTIGGILTVTGNLVVNGTTTTVNSSTMTVDDPIVTLGGDAAPASDDNKDRGVEYRYHTGSAAKVGYFGYDDSTGFFTFIPDATNTSEVFSGTQGTISVLAYNIGANTVLSGTTLGSTIVTSSLTSLGTISTGTWEATDVAVGHGGTGASTAAAARTNLGATTKVTATIGDGSATAIAVTHSLGTDDVVVEVYGATSKETVVCDVDRTSTNAVTLTFASAPASNAYKVVIIG